MSKVDRKFKNGVASFYIVAFATLILMILTVSFAAVIISEVTRTSNEDLAQSAYDSALAGVEDAKVAYANYQKCVEAGYEAPASWSNNGELVSCSDIMYWMKNPDCDMVAHILGRIGKGEKKEVLVSESTDGTNSLNQAYTCAKINIALSDYRATIASSNPTKVVKVKLDGVDANEITAIRVSWYSNPGGEKYNYNNFFDNRVVFRQIATFRAATPPTIAVQLVQTATAFKMEELFEPTTDDGRTDRATVYLVPTDKDGTSGDEKYNYIAYNGEKNIISKEAMAATNNMAKNLPYAVYCPKDTGEKDFACTAEIELPEPISNAGGGRNEDTFMIAVNVPYGQPNTDFAIEYLCGNEKCSATVVGGSGEKTEKIIKDAQIMIDVTGRANDLYRRVETRFETSDASFPYQFYTTEAFNSKEPSSSLIKKELTVTKEWNFNSES